MMKKLILATILITACGQQGQVSQTKPDPKTLETTFITPSPTSDNGATTTTTTTTTVASSTVNSSVKPVAVSKTDTTTDSVTADPASDPIDPPTDDPTPVVTPTPTPVITPTPTPVVTPTPTPTPVDTTPPTAITNIKTTPTQSGQDTRITNVASNYVTWVGGTDAESGIAKYVVYEYSLSSCAGTPTAIEVHNQYYNFSADLDTTYSFAIKAVNTIGLETLSGCSGDLLYISTQTAVANPSISINSGDTYTKNQTVTLTFSATNATDLYVTNDAGCNSNGSWQTYTINRSWTLAETNTTATVYVKYKDSHDRESDCIHANIIHDSLPPTNPTLSFSRIGQFGEFWNGSDFYTANTHIDLVLGATDASEMFITNTAGCTTNGTWEPYATSKAWVLAQTNTLDYVYAKFRDVAGNETDCIYTSIQHIDTDAPANPAIFINWSNLENYGLVSAEFTNSQNVNLLLIANDYELSAVAISNGTSCTGTYQNVTFDHSASTLTTIGSPAYQQTWTLGVTSGIAYVSAKFKDAAGNESGCTTASIHVANNASQVFVGEYNTCILSSGQAKCFGRNDYGQLGYGITQANTDANVIGKTSATVGLNATNINVGTGRTITQLALGAGHTCALLDNGSVKCWGLNNWGQLGLGTTDNVTTMGDALQAVNLGGPAAEISAGIYHTCARLVNGSIKCWGNNSFAQLGIGNTVNVGDEPSPVFTAVDLGTGKTAIQVSAGSTFTCALLNDHTAKCWGQNSNKQGGQDAANYTHDGTDLIGNQPNELGDNLPAIKVGVGRTINQLATGDAFACALLDDGGVKCWGAYTSGQWGYMASYSATGNNRPYVNFGPESNSVVKISAGDEHTCVVLNDGRTKCFGRNSSGQLGQGNTIWYGQTNDMSDDTLLPFISLGTNKTVVNIKGGAYHTCAVFSDNTAKCWGGNGYGQLGAGSTTNIGDNQGQMGNSLPEL